MTFLFYLCLFSGAKRRYLQGEFRSQMLMHIETKKDALARRKSASVTGLFVYLEMFYVSKKF